ncbi:MAG TPA: 23S rRNA (cytidine(2498)-2'-O)-methyltransferase RlmM [Moraxellaceae bacterium]|nr:23S rRNA (cytidine(2498)-2'-O)-methyltransferase RlmM [Moraxellaceae bacterium]
MTAAFLLYCRPGFEKEAAAEIQDMAARQALAGYARARPDAGYLTFHPHVPATPAQAAALRLDELVFARQLVRLDTAEPAQLPADDRISPLLALLRAAGGPWRELRAETADTNEAKALSGFLRKFTPALESALRKAGLLDRRGHDTLHLFFLDSTHVLAGASDPANASPWPLGIPRLKFPAAAPSRSTLKLEEAFLHFLDAGERERLLREGATGVDLGAAPGGWTWQLVRHGLQVTAIDNGAMDAALMRSGQVEHLRVDGFHYRPPRPVNWLVCDMVEQPLRIATLCAGWVADGAAERAMFNLKLPMKKRYEEVRLCVDAIARRLDGRPHTLRLKQLYHDREEVTAYLHLS